MKKNRLLLLIIFLLCIGVSKVSAKTSYWCYYQDEFISAKKSDNNYMTLPESGGNFNVDLQKTYIEMRVSDNYKATFYFYDSTNKKSVEKITFTGSDYLLDGSLSFSDDSGAQLKESDFTNGCPTKLDRISLGENNGKITFVYDIFKDNPNDANDYYDKMYTKASDQVWPGVTGASSTSPCYIKNNSTESSHNLHMCARVGIQTLPETVEPKKEGSSNVVCEYANPDDIAAEGNGLYVQVSLKFNESDGKYIENTGYNKFSNDTTATPSFSLVKNGGKYVCPSAVYDCSESHDGMNLTDSACQDGKKYSLIRSIHVKTNEQDITGCAMYEGVGKYISGAYTLIRYLIPTLIVILSTADFVGVVFSGEQDKMEKAKYKFMMRLIIGVVALLIPFLFELILKLAGVIGSGDSLADIACNLLG